MIRLVTFFWMACISRMSPLYRTVLVWTNRVPSTTAALMGGVELSFHHRGNLDVYSVGCADAGHGTRVA